MTNSLNGSIYDSMDYLPYGEQIAGGTGTTHKFTGKERDAESGLDDFDARYYSSNLGRFVSADWSATPVPIPYADFNDPQSLNLYTYVRNVPTVRTDPNGHDWISALNLAMGAVQAFGSDLAMGAGRTQEVTSDGKLGQAIGDAMAAVAGIAETVVGAGGDVVGTGLDATGVGALAGVPLQVASTALVVHGVATTATGGSNVGHDIHDAMQSSKAKDAPGVSSSGQATDEHGNKLGGSGKPQQHGTQSNTQEGARNKALNDGQTAVKHSNPKQGKPHFHSGDAQGNKKPNSTHHNYPD
jgi:RHS repeat-associated protein